MKIEIEVGVIEAQTMSKWNFRRWLCDTLGCERKQRVVFGWTVGQPQLKKKRIGMLELTCTNEQQIKVRLNPRTDAGKPAKLDGVPVWSVVSGPGTVVA